MIAHGDEEVKEQLAPNLHLHLHGAAALEGGPAADDERQIVRPHLRVGVGRVRIGVSGAGQYGAALDARLQTLLPQGQALELVEPVLVGRAVDDRVLEDDAGHAVVVDGRLDRAPTVGAVLELPGVSAFVVADARVVVALVEVLEHRREDLGLLVGEVDAAGVALLKLASTAGGEEGRQAEDVLMGGEQTLFPTADYGDDGRGKGAARSVRTLPIERG